ncbi:MAG: hypothetical protein ACK5JD_00625 [Mangrovibacterium sp.]
MKILTISTLYEKGGAAFIAKTLHHEFMQQGHETKYLVGYGSKGLPDKTQDKGVEKADYRFMLSPHLNFLIHSIVGKDIFSPNKTQLVELIQWADVIICHTLHSYFVSYSFLFDLFIRLGKEKRVYFVAHDSWHYTGRCASIHSCEDWKKGCLLCIHKNHYPKSLLSISHIEWKRKVNKINKIPNLSFISPANWIALDLREAYPNIPTFLVRNGIDSSKFDKLYVRNKENKQVEFGVSSVNLSQPGKINFSFVRELLNKGYKVHFIGQDNPEFQHSNAIDHGYISSREQYFKILDKFEIYLFTSTIDVYPTVLIEAICAGKFIFYTPSKGAKEIMESEKQWPGVCIHSTNDMLSTLQSQSFTELVSNTEYREEKRREALDFFSMTTMVNNYINLIKAID